MQLRRLNITPTLSRSRRAFSLIELITALAISSIIVAALGSAVMIASASMPTAESELADAVGTDIDWLSIEMSEALFVKAAGGAALSLTIPDRDGDFQPELVEYAWDGITGSPLIRNYNNGPDEAVTGALDDFSVTTDSSIYTVGVSPDIMRERVDAINLKVMPSGSTRPIGRSISLANRPHNLTVWARTDFDADPTLIDRDRSGQSEWSTTTPFDETTLEQGWWRADKNLTVNNLGMLDTPFTVSKRVNLDAYDLTSVIEIVCDVDAAKGAMLYLSVWSSDSDQTISLKHRSRGWTEIAKTIEPLGPVDVTLAVEPKSDTVTLFVNDKLINASTYNSNSAATFGSIEFSKIGAYVLIDSIDVRVGGTSP